MTPSPRPGHRPLLRLEPVTAASLDTALGVRVRPGQEHLVAPVVKSLAEACVHPSAAWPRLILDGERPVGFLMPFPDIDSAGNGTGTDSARACGGTPSPQANWAAATTASPSTRRPPRSAAATAPG